MRNLKLIVAVVMVATLSGCSKREVPLTGSYGNAVVVGQVVMSDGVANSSPAGVEVSVVGTGMVSTLGGDGRFSFAGVPENAELLFRRGSDGVSARIPARAGQPMTVHLGQSSASSSNRRRGASPKREFEGVIRSLSGSSFVLFTSHKEEVTITTDASTTIRKGNTALTFADLKVDDRVHVKGTSKDNVVTALEVVVQNGGDDDDDDDDGESMTANGPVLSVNGTSLVVSSRPKGEITVQTDAGTIIKRQGDRIAVSDIKVGDEVNCQGQRVDDHTLLARQIEVRGNSKGKKRG